MNINYIRKWHSTILFKSLQTLEKSDRRKLITITILQSGLAILDLAGVAAIGLVGALAVTGVQSMAPGNRVSAALNFLNLESSSIQIQVAVVGLLAAFLFLSRTVLSIIISRRIRIIIRKRIRII